jgi:signal transduction histidine kinase
VARRWSPGSISIQYKLPLLICTLLLAVVLLSSWAAYRGVRTSAFVAARERLTKVTDQLSSMLRTSAGVLGAATQKAAANDSLRAFLRAPNPRTRAAAEALLMKIGPNPEQVVGAELWSMRRERLLSVKPHGVESFHSGAQAENVEWSTNPDTGAVGLLQKVGDSIVYPVSAIVTDHGRSLGYLIQWRRPTSTQKSREATLQLVGSGAGVYIGNTRGDFWMDLLDTASPPPMNVREQTGIVEYDRAGVGSVLAASRSLGRLPWVVLVEFPRSLVAGPVNLLLKSLAMKEALLVAIGFAAAWILGRRIAKPLRELTTASSELAAGSYSRPVTTTRTDELGHLATAFNSMAAQMQGAQARLEEQVRERTAALEERNEELEAFGYSISHDLRAPLRTMQGFSEALLEDFGAALPPTGRDYAERVVAGSRRMDELIRDLLAYSRVSRGDLQLTPVPLRPVADTAVAELDAPLRARAGTVRVAESLPVVQGHAGTLSQVFSNLLGNALKFVPNDRAPVIEVSTERRNGMVRVWVVDNGIGIAFEHRERIFRVFERLHSAEEYPGTGIGLAIVRKAVERMGGKVGVDSTMGQGSRFWIELQPVEGKPAT